MWTAVIGHRLSPVADCPGCFYGPLCSCIKACNCLNSFKKTSFSRQTLPCGPVVTYFCCCRYDCIQKDRSNLWVVIDTVICRKSDTFCVYCHRPLELQLMLRPRNVFRGLIISSFIVVFRHWQICRGF